MRCLILCSFGARVSKTIVCPRVRRSSNLLAHVRYRDRLVKIVANESHRGYPFCWTLWASIGKPLRQGGN
jgi:hypothetical protein